jgi:acetyl-CoA acetyltransferase
MLSGRNVYIEGAALEISWRDEGRNLSELIFDTVTRAVDDAGLGYDGIDSTVLAAHDLVDGRSLSSMVTAPAAGAYLRDEIRYSDDGAAAFAAAVVRVEAGDANRSIVAAWGRSSEHDVEAYARSFGDPFFLREFGLEELHFSAFNAQKWHINGGEAGAMPAAQAKRELAAQSNPRALKAGGFRSKPAYPLMEQHLPLWADVVAAVVISPNPTGVKVRGLGQSSEPYWPGDRRLGKAPALNKAALTALAEAGIAISQVDLFELDGFTLYDEAIALEAIGLAEPGCGFKTLAQDARCNPSGGSASGYCAPAMGLVRLVEATLQLQRRAGSVQQGTPRIALASGSSVIAAQTQTVAILEAA